MRQVIVRLAVAAAAMAAGIGCEAIPAGLSPPADSPGVAVPPAGGGAVRFFGLSDRADKIAYLIDTAGASPETFQYVQAELLRSIGALGAQQQFAVVLFSEGSPRALAFGGQPRLAAGGGANVRAARDFVLGQTEGGQGDRDAAWRAVRCALELDGGPPQAVFLLTPRLWPSRLAERISQLNTTSSPGGHRLVARIHTIAFLHSQSRELLGRIAASNGGGHRFVEAVDLGKE